MKRYDLEENGAPGDSWRELIERDDGEWVRFEDVELEKAAAVARAIIICEQNTAEKHAIEIQCNCDKASGNPRYRNDLRFDSDGSQVWIYPAHGYKKL